MWSCHWPVITKHHDDDGGDDDDVDDDNQIKSVLLLRQYAQRRPGSVVHQTIQVFKNETPKIRSKKTSTDNRVYRQLWRESQIKDVSSDVS